MGIFDSFNDSLHGSNNQSPFGEAGLLGDPLHYLIGDKYDNFMRKTWEMPNKYLGQGITKFDTFDRKINPIHRAIDKTELGGKIKDLVHNKPGDSALAVLGTIFGGGALLGGMGGGASGGAAGGTGGVGFGATGSGFQGASSFAPGMSVGGGNAGLLASSGGISGGAGTAGGAAGGASQLGMQDYMKMGQQMMGGQQQQQQQAPAPTAPVRRDNSAFMAQLARQDRAQALRRKLNRTPDENAELRQLTQTGLLA